MHQPEKKGSFRPKLGEISVCTAVLEDLWLKVISWPACSHHQGRGAVFSPFMSPEPPVRVSVAALSPPESREFRDVYDAHLTWVCHALRRHSVAEKDVLDAAQNVFLVVHRKLEEFEGRAALRTWIAQIVRRVASDYRRSAPVRREVFTEVGHFDDKAGSSASAEEATSRAEQMHMARTIIDSLPETQRTVFIMYELEQMSGQEIADELALPLGTVRSRLRLARDAFRSEVSLLVSHAPKLEVG